MSSSLDGVKLTRQELREIIMYLRSIFGHDKKNFPKFKYDKESGTLMLDHISLWKIHEDQSFFIVGHEWYTSGTCWDPPDGGVDEFEDGRYQHLYQAVQRIIRELVDHRIYECSESIQAQYEYDQHLIERVME
jgi:hypothetical protein